MAGALVINRSTMVNGDRAAIASVRANRTGSWRRKIHWNTRAVTTTTASVDAVITSTRRHVAGE